jgi:PncC family amidohydrolase
MDQHTELINKAGRLLQKEGATVAVAESVTSGNLQAIFSLAKNATLFFQGGMTAYNIGQKCRHLMVEPTHAIECNCVSQKVSEQMAAEICHLFISDYGIGITGYASPVPEKNIQQLYAWLSIAKGNEIMGSKKIISPHKKPLEVQLEFTQKAIEYFIEILKKK